ncbi:MAG TPA: FAD-binding oxidoreductase [Dongiaceae bacterium]|jgi:glycine/D-amino acid oxidase-like deaminating enzyme|nr:FAD-binding oxidoreductase [Dongiaceae bacterium]
MTSYDVVIAGGGLTGLATAYFLLSNSDFSGTLAVVEPDPSYRQAATPRSAGGIRQQFSTPENIRISQASLQFMREAHRHLRVADDIPHIAFHERGYLFLGTDADRLRELALLQNQHGARTEFLSPAVVAASFPWLAVQEIAGANFGPNGEGWLDPHALLMAFRAKVRALGAHFLTDRVATLEISGQRIEHVSLESGARLATGALVNQSGIAAWRIAELAGVDLPVRARKRCVFTFACATALPAMPLCVAPDGTWWRPEGASYLCGGTPPLDEEDESDEVDHALFEERLWPTLARYVPAFATIKPGAAWAGHYDYNTFDCNVLIGPAPNCANLYFANGFSGHGFQQAPAIGRAVAELIVYGAYRTLDLRRLGYERYLKKVPLAERHVV